MLHILVSFIIRAFGVWLGRRTLVFALGEHSTDQLNESAENEGALEPDSDGSRDGILGDVVEHVSSDLDGLEFTFWARPNFLNFSQK